MKEILHFKFDKSISRGEEVGRFMKMIKDNLEEKYLVIATPYDLSCPTNDDIFINIEGIDYTYEQVLKRLKP